MYAWIWRRLPGPWPVRLFFYLILILAVVAALFFWGFPWFEETFEINRVTFD